MKVRSLTPAEALELRRLQTDLEALLLRAVGILRDLSQRLTADAADLPTDEEMARLIGGEAGCDSGN